MVAALAILAISAQWTSSEHPPIKPLAQKLEVLYSGPRRDFVVARETRGIPRLLVYKNGSRQLLYWRVLGESNGTFFYLRGKPDESDWVLIFDASGPGYNGPWYEIFTTDIKPLPYFRAIPYVSDAGPLGVLGSRDRKRREGIGHPTGLACFNPRTQKVIWERKDISDCGDARWDGQNVRIGNWTGAKPPRRDIVLDGRTGRTISNGQWR